MKKRLICLTLIGLFAMGVNAETELNISGQIRARGEADKKSFVEDAHMKTFTLLRTRINLDATVDENTHAFIQFQDSRTYGVPSSGDLGDNKNVDIHQAFIKVDNFFGEGWGVQAGRFEFKLGNERVLGPVGWSNVGRAWDGGLMWYDGEKYKITLAAMKAVEMNNSSYNADFDVFGAFADLKEYNLNLFWLYELNSDTSGFTKGIKKLQRHNLGLFYKRSHEQWDFTLNSVYQFGTQGNTSIPIFPNPNEDDISAYMFAFEAGYNLEDEKNTKLAFGIDYTTGDDKVDTDWEAYNNLYYTGHAFRGYMDYFVNSPDHGLMDIMFRAKTDITKGWVIKGDLHFFSAAQKYSYIPDPTSPLVMATSKDVGMEIDITVKTSRIKGISMQWGLSYFSPKDDFATMREDIYSKEAGLWLYEQATVNF